MNFGLFAKGPVGLEVARTFATEPGLLRCLAVDDRDTSDLNAEIVRCAGMTEGGLVVGSDRLYEEATVAKLQALGLDLIVLGWWPYIIKRPLLDLPSRGFLNFHPSLLPFNRGKDSNFWTIMENTPFGVSLQWINQGVDTGDIAYQSRIDKDWEDTGGSLYAKATQEIVRLFREHFAEIKSGNIPRVPQSLTAGSSHKRSELEPASRIELDRTYQGRDLLNLLRARTFRPHPAAWFVDQGEKYEVRIEITKVGVPGGEKS